MKTWHSLLIGLFLSSSIALPVKAQITVDGTTNTTLTPIDTGIRIDDGDRAGANLFHSFEQFSILNGSEAFFNNANDIVNIFSRVTGGNISTIDGLLRANGTANLFLLNPAGIIFGKNAQLDIGGSFLSSTADSIVFSDGVKFLATGSDEPPLLTINMPIGLNLGNNPGDIVNRSYNGNGLEVATGESITLVGGNINLEGGRLFAPEGRVELGGLSAAGKVGINADGSLIFPEGVTRADVTLTNGAEVDVRGAGGGIIGVNARNIELSGGELGSSNLFAGIAENSDSTEAQAGDITLNATDTITAIQGSDISNEVLPTGVGNSGRINITTNNLFLSEGSQVTASTFGDGDGGKITITASGTISAKGEDSQGLNSGVFSQVGEKATGNSEGIEITTTNLSLQDGGLVDASTFGDGEAGKITITASGTISAKGEDSPGLSSGVFSQVGEKATGNSEGIEITTTDLSLQNGGVLTASTFGEGNAGKITITVTASGTISAEGESSQGLGSGIFSIVGETAIGNSEGIEITTTDLSLQDGGQVSSSTFGEGNAGKITITASGTISAEGESSTFASGIFSIVVGTAIGNSEGIVVGTAIGNSEGIEITTTNLSLQDGSEVNASTAGEGKAGAITINVDDDLSLTNNAEISVQSFGQGNANNLFIQANSLTLSNDSSLLASTPIGTGGNIDLTVADSLTLRDDSFISAQALGEANGGNLIINAGFVLAFPSPNEGNDIIASASQGRGGNINITAQGIFGLEEGRATDNDGNRLRNGTNDLDASSQLGTDGIITINELEANPAEGIEDIPRFVIDPDKLVIFSLCSLARDSEFYYTAKGGNAPNLAEVREEGVIAVDLVEPVTLEEEEQGSSPKGFPKGLAGASANASGAEGAGGAGGAEDRGEIVEAQGWILNEKGVVELVAYKTHPNGVPAQPKDPRVCPK